MGKTLRLTKFRDINLDDAFFDSLKSQYKEFPDWFKRKSDEYAYVIDDDLSGGIRGFVYLKIEDGAIVDVSPSLPAKRRLKVGTFKVDARGTKLGERIIKRILDHALRDGAAEVYVTIFDTHDKLIQLFQYYGFVEHGSKNTPNGREIVLLKSLEAFTGDIIKDYPLLHTENTTKWLLAIYPEYHTKLFPDSILRTENPDMEEDVAYTNTIHKIYIAKLALTRMERGDIVVIYRTTDIPGRARFRSVATSVCVVEESRSRRDFPSVESFIDFAKNHSVFDESELRARYLDGEQLFAVKMTYNAAFIRRPNRGRLLDDVGISEYPRWDLRRLTDAEFSAILELGELNENLVVD